MRISALTMTPSTKPCARATSTSAALLWVIRVAMIAPLPTNTRAKVRMNSATKCRHESRMSRPLRKWRERARSSDHSTQNQRGVDSAEAERVGEHVLHSLFPPSSRQKIKIAGFIRNLKVDRGRQPLALDRQRANRRLDRARCAKSVAVVSLRSTQRNPVRTITEHLLDRHSFSGIIERRRAPVRIHVVDFAGGHFRVLERESHRPRRL